MKGIIFHMNEAEIFYPASFFLNDRIPIEFYKGRETNIIEKKIFQPRGDCEPVELTFPIDWEGNNLGSDLNWRMQLQGWTMFHAVINFFDQYPDKSSIFDYYIKVARDWWDN